MDKSIWITAALAAVLVGFGVVVGAGFPGSEPSAGTHELPGLLTADGQRPASPPTAPSLGTDLGPQVLQRLGRLEAAVEALRKEQSQMTRGVKPAADLLAFFQSKVPSLTRARLNANRTAAIATMRNCVSAQAQVQASARVDTDNDGTGEYGGFREMSGAVAGRMSRHLIPPVLSSAFRKLNEYGEVTRSGYLYRIYLPGANGEGIGEPREGFSPSSGIDSDLSETTWCCYAWPVDASKGGGQVFFTNQGGDVLSTVDTRYSGPGNGPLPDSAFMARKTITGAVAIGKQGQDGNVWKQVN